MRTLKEIQEEAGGPMDRLHHQAFTRAAAALSKETSKAMDGAENFLQDARGPSKGRGRGEGSGSTE